MVLELSGWSRFSADCVQLLRDFSLANAYSVVLSTEFNILWCGLTALYALGTGIWLVRRVYPLRRDLKSAREVLLPIRTPEDFASAYESVNPKLRAIPTLCHIWSEFTESLIWPTEETERRVVRNTTPPAEYFSEDAFLFPAIHFRFFNSVPNQLTALGILGTFVGLSFGIGNATNRLVEAMAQNDTKKMAEALLPLLQGAGLAFLTSLVGVAASVLFLIAEKAVVRQLHDLLDQFVGLLEKFLIFVTPQGVALEQLAHAARQTQQLEKFNTELVWSIEQALDEKIAGKLVPKLEELIAATNGIRDDRSTSNVDLVATMLADFTESLRGNAGRELDSVASTFASLDQGMQRTVQGLEASQTRTQQMLETFIERFDSSLKMGTQNLDQELGRATGTLTATLEAMRQNLAGTLEESATAAAGSVRDSASQVNAAMEQAAERLQRAADSAGSSMEQGLRSALDGAVVEARGVVAGAAQEMAAASKSAAADMVQTFGSLQANVDRLGTTVDSTRRLMDGVNEMLSRMGELGAVLAKAKADLDGVTTPLRLTAERMGTASDRVAQSLSTTHEVVARVGEIAATLDTSRRELEGVWNNYETRFRSVDSSLATVFQSITEGLGQYTKQVREFMDELDKHTSKSISSLASATGELNTAIEDLGEAIRPAKAR